MTLWTRPAERQLAEASCRRTDPHTAALLDDGFLPRELRLSSTLHMINLEVEGSIQRSTLLYRHRSWPNSVIAVKRDDAIRTALPILQRSQAGQTSYTLTEHPKLERCPDGKHAEWPPILRIDQHAHYQIPSWRLRYSPTRTFWLFKSSSLGLRLRAGLY